MSLFDVAADLSQFAGAAADDALRNSSARSTLRSRSSTLCILDETLQTIYDSRRPSPASAAIAPPTELRASKSSEQLEQRLRELGAKSSSSADTQPQPQPQQQQQPAAPKTALQHTRSSEADMTAKTILRQVSDEVEQLAEMRGASSGSHAAASAARFLTEKYIDAQLNKLPATPFVQLARKKALLKIQQLNQQQQQQLTTGSTAPPVSSSTQIDTGGELWRRLRELTAPQHALLQQLARVPEERVAALPQSQQELAHFARRYELVRAMSARDIARLQPHQQQIVRQLQLAATTH